MILNTALIKAQKNISMYDLENIKKRSASPNETVLTYADAMVLLSIYEKTDVKVLGWEGWIKYPDGRLGHSSNHQGTVCLSSLSKVSALTLIRSTIIESYREWLEDPEVQNAELLFCITTNIY